MVTMRRKLPPLNALRAFEIASRFGSFTIAARELSVSQSAVSRHIAHLEACLGVPLFDRRHREVRLTEQGQAYAAEVQKGFDQLLDATAKLLKGGENQLLRVALFPSIAARWLMPRLPRFYDENPDIQLSITTTVDRPDLEADTVDIANYRGIPSDPRVDYLALFDVALRPVCSPALLSGPKALKDPRDLGDLILLHSLNRLDDWRIWLEAAGVTGVDPRRGLRFENSALAYQAAIDGVGVVMAQTNVIADELLTGRLVAPFQLAVRTGESYGLAWLKARSDDIAIRAFREWIAAEASKSDVG